MNADQLPCLGRFKQHSCESWYWDGNQYCRECTLFGCSFSETAVALSPVGKIDTTGTAPDYTHDWNPWQSTADQYGLYLPPWRYRRNCRSCDAKQVAEALEKVPA